MIYSDGVKEVIKMLGDNIRYLRLKQGLSQDFLADKLGYKSYTTIQKWESGVSEPPVKKLKELASIFNIDMDDLASKDLQAENNNSLTLQKLDIILSNEEVQLVKKYREADDVSKAAIQRLLYYYSNVTASDPYSDIPASPEELEKKYPPIDIDDVKGKIG